MKTWAPVLLGGIVVATAMMFAPWSDPLPAAPPPVQAAPVAKPAPPARAAVPEGFGAAGTVFRSSAAPTQPDRLAEAEARADDRATTRDDTVPATAPREH